MTLSANDQYLLNHLNNVAFKTALGRRWNRYLRVKSHSPMAPCSLAARTTLRLLKLYLAT